MKIYALVLSLLVAVGFSFNLSAQCDSVALSKTTWSLLYANHYNAGSSPAANCFDSNNSTFYQTVNAAGNEYPHELWIDLGTSPAVNGIGYTPRQANTWNGKLGNYEIYTSWDTLNWGTPEAAGTITYTNSNDNGTRYLYFGAVAAPYVRIVALSSPGTEIYWDVAEIDVFYNTCGGSGLQNQVISLVEIGKQVSTNAPITLNGSNTSGLPINYSISGPASLSNGQLVLDGTAGMVTLKAHANGDATYYPSDTVYRIFEVIDLADYNPTMETRLVGGNIFMPSLMAYPLYVSASIAETDYLRIDSMQFEISGETIDTIFRIAPQAWGAHWTPSAYGTYNVKMTAVANNGSTADTTIAITVSNTAADQSIVTFNQSLISFGQSSRTIYQSFELPQFAGAYDSVHAQLNITCPSGGCDPYDRVAWIEMKDPTGNWVQIIRYITPFGIACSHNIDVSQYMDLLQGNTELRFFVDTWAGGWEATLTLEYFEGTPNYPYTWVTEIWDGDYPFGNPANLQPIDTVTHTFFSNTQAAKFMLSNSGHGWGSNNTGNAAEFYRPEHKVIIAGNTYLQDLWNFCNPNPDGCNNQAGTWQYDRAGWCPGAISPPDVYDLSSLIGSNSSFNLSYVFQESYMDMCHPQNPNCISGTTCPDCNGDINPHYYVDGHLISYSSSPFIPKQPELPTVIDPTASTGISTINSSNNFTFNLYPNPATNQFYLDANPSINKPIVVIVVDISGKQYVSYYFQNAQQLNSQAFSINHLAAGMYFVTIQSGENRTYKKLVVE